MDEGAIREGVHYTNVAMQVDYWSELGQVIMVEKQGEVMFVG